MNLPTKIFQADPLLSEKDLEEVIGVFGRGGIVAIPTETVYGLASDLFNEAALQEIFRAKGRPADNPLIAHVAEMQQAEKLVKAAPDLFYRLAERFWPGPLTLIAPRSKKVPDIAAAGLDTVAIRMPSHGCALQILQRTGPLAAPSANLSGRPSPTSAIDVLEDFDGVVPFVVDGGNSVFGIESTVVHTGGDILTLLRPGAIPREEIEEFLGMRLGNPKQGERAASPGMKYRHYAPKANVFLVEHQEELEMFRKEGAYVPEFVTAQTLYAELRRADRLQKKAIAIYVDARILLDEALLNRLVKASADFNL